MILSSIIDLLNPGLFNKNYKPLKKLYGILERRIKESSQKMKDRLRKELY